MDHSCYQCGQSIEEGKPFCAHCGAPQIRVATPEVVEPLSDGEQESALATEAQAGFSSVPLHPLPAKWSNAMRPCALASAVAVVLMFLGLNPFVAAFVAGLLASTFFQRRSHAAIRPAAGARLGALSGVFLFGMSTVFETIAILMLHKGSEIRSEMMEKVQLAASRYPAPQVEPFLDFVKSPGGFAFMMGASLVFGLLAFAILAALGGAISCAISSRRSKP